jgi:alpha-1,2-mannosyltransferase
VTAGTWRLLLLAGLCAAASLHLAGLAWGYARDVLQLDLSAYVTAGEALARGLDPYRNHPDQVPPVWDGKSEYRHSRFLYPPLVAVLFRPLAALPYSVAKGLFTLLSLAALVDSTLLLWRELRFRSPERLLVLLALLASAFPVRTLLERGQVDAFTLLLLVFTFRPALQGRTPGIASGMLLALATLLKLNAVYLALFFALRRWWRALLGLVLGGTVLLAVGAGVHGPEPLSRYATEELPRISRYGESGNPAMRLDDETLNRLRGDVPEGFGRKDGRLYRVEAEGFAANASGARFLAHVLAFRRPRAALAPLSFAILGSSLLFTAWAVRGRPLSAGAEELAFFAMALTAVLLAGPLTWVMNVVWLVAGGVFLAVAAPGAARPQRWLLAGVALGLTLAWIPDQHALALLGGVAPLLGDVKYVVAETLVLLSVGAWLRTRVTVRTRCREQSSGADGRAVASREPLPPNPVPGKDH